MNGRSNCTKIKVLTDVDSILTILNEFSDSLQSLRRGCEFRKTMAVKFAQNAKFLTINSNREEVLGFAAFYCNDQDSLTAYLSMIAIKSEFRQCGYGKYLFDKMVDISLENQMKAIKLEVDRNNISALSFYKTLGFVEEIQGEKTIYLRKQIVQREHASE